MDKLQLFDLSNRTKLHLTGRQALWFLDQLITNQVVELEHGCCSDGLLLNPKGRIQAMMRVLSTPEGAFVDVEPGEREDVYEFFSRRVFATKVVISDVTNDYKLWRVFGNPRAVFETLGASWTERSGEGAVNAPFDGGYVTKLPVPMDGCVDVWAQSDAATEIGAKLQAEALSAGEYEALRVGRGLPSFEKDLAGGYLPQEGALERAVHFKKGCYLGQEAVAMAQRGKLKKRLRHLEFSADAAAGEVEFDGQPAGAVTSAAGGKGIGMVKTTVPVDAEVIVRGDGASAAAVVRKLPGTVEGPSVPSARELRERLKGAEKQ